MEDDSSRERRRTRVGKKQAVIKGKSTSARGLTGFARLLRPTQQAATGWSLPEDFNMPLIGAQAEAQKLKGERAW